MATCLPNWSGKIPSLAKRRDRRASSRCSPCRTTPCYLTSSLHSTAIQAQVYNLSAFGLGIVGAPWIAPGTVVHLELINAGHMFVLPVDMCVTRVETASSGGHYLAGQFTRKLTYDELLPFLI